MDKNRISDWNRDRLLGKAIRLRRLVFLTGIWLLLSSLSPSRAQDLGPRNHANQILANQDPEHHGLQHPVPNKPAPRSASSNQDRMIILHGPFADRLRSLPWMRSRDKQVPIDHVPKRGHVVQSGHDSVPLFDPQRLPKSSVIQASHCDAGCDGLSCDDPTCGVETHRDHHPSNGRSRLGGQWYPVFADGRRRLGRFPEPSNFDLRLEYLLFWTNPFEAPPLLTTSTPGTSISNAGVLGLSSTRVLSNQEFFDDEERPGARITFDYWLDPDRFHAIQAIYTGLGNQSDRFQYTSNQYSILARPFQNIEVGGQDAELIAFPGQLTGSATIEAESEFGSLEILYRAALARHCDTRVDFLVGWRHNYLDESIRFSDFKRVTGTALGVGIGTTLEEQDYFETENRFHGVQIGVQAQHQRNRWSYDGTCKIALGNNRSQVHVDGSAEFREFGPPGIVTQSDSGLLALPSNMGTSKHDDFSISPELGLTLGYAFNRNIQGTLGYTFIYYSRVARPGDQIDTVLNLTQLDPGGLVGAARPARQHVLDDLWVQGLRFGLNFDF